MRIISCVAAADRRVRASAAPTAARVHRICMHPRRELVSTRHRSARAKYLPPTRTHAIQIKQHDKVEKQCFTVPYTGLHWQRSWLQLFVSIETMRKPGQWPDRNAPGHFQPRVRAACCEHFYIAYIEEAQEIPSYQKFPELRGNSVGHKALVRGWRTFRQAHMHAGTLYWQPRGMTKKDFCKILHKYWKDWNESRECKSKSRSKPVNLTAAEWEELAKELTTPLGMNGCYVRFTSISDAKAKKPRVKELFMKAGVGCQLLHRELLKRFPDVQYGPEDRSARLCPSTIAARRMLADQWAGRAPWFQLPQSECINPPRRSERLQQMTEVKEDMNDEAPEPINVYWRREWMSQFCFMLDATSFSNAEGPLSKKAPRVYYSSTDVYGPREVRANYSLSQATTIMVYAVIHPYLGVVVGPDVMFTGTRFKNSTKSKEKQFQDAEVKSWCEFSELPVR